jgi:hypothetical protein
MKNKVGTKRINQIWDVQIGMFDGIVWFKKHMDDENDSSRYLLL